KTINFGPDDELFLLGDFIDRGPNSMGVLDTVWELTASGHQVTCLRGNHEQMLIDYADGRRDCFDWNPPPDRFQETIDWIHGLPLYHQTPGYFLVHAGLNFAAPNPIDDTYAMLWIRDWYGDLDKNWLGDRVLLHGHTPTPVESIKQSIYFMNSTQRVCLDSGCAWDRRGLGYLTVLNLDTREGIFLENRDKPKPKGLFSWSVK
ncbi:MAG: metallophosphoesterase, partial [Bacteroidota bacterium]